MARDPLAEWLEHLVRLSKLTSEDDRSRYRIAVTRDDPLMFALLYLRRHFQNVDGEITLSEVHIQWAKTARKWRKPVKVAASSRDAFLAPRSTGKSTWWFLAFPMWSAAHGHVKFVAAFADSGPQAESHLSTFKSELDRNPLLRQDFPDLVKPLVRPRSGSTVADNRGLMQLSNGFVFTARGVDAGNLGMKIGERRPDVIICDDLEPGESNYSAYQAGKRRTTLLDDILPLNIFARVILVGTTTMSGSVSDQLRQVATGNATAETAWVSDESFDVHFTPAIATGHDGRRRSIWPEKWPLAWLEEREHTREFAKNYALSPLGADGAYWTMEDFTREKVANISYVLLEIDPAVTSKKTSDYTGLAVVGFNRVEKKCVVLAAVQVKLPPDKVAKLVVKMVDQYDVGLVRVETNQGGELWTQILEDVPVRVRTVHETAAKEVRAAQALVHYQRRPTRVYHDPDAKLADLEAQMVAFPMVANDDLVDAVGAGVRYFLDKKPTKIKAGGVAMSYA